MRLNHASERLPSLTMRPNPHRPQMRNGTDVDRDSLENVLKDLDFDVEVYNDLRKSELFAVLDKREMAKTVM